MSHLPFFGESLLDTIRPSRLLHQHFDDRLTPEDLLAPFTIPLRMMNLGAGYFRPWKSAAAHLDAGSTVACDGSKFQVSLDVQQFGPEEITVKVTGDRQITVEGKHEEKQDVHGFISRHFVRRYLVPDGYDMDQLVSTLSSDGVLTVSAPRAEVGAMDHRAIPVVQTGQPVAGKSEQKEDN